MLSQEELSAKSKYAQGVVWNMWCLLPSPFLLGAPFSHHNRARVRAGGVINCSRKPTCSSHYQLLPRVGTGRLPQGGLRRNEIKGIKLKTRLIKPAESKHR